MKTETVQHDCSTETGAHTEKIIAVLKEEGCVSEERGIIREVTEVGSDPAHTQTRR